MTRMLLTVFGGICLLLFPACEREGATVVPSAERTLLVYMVADNSLG